MAVPKRGRVTANIVALPRAPRLPAARSLLPSVRALLLGFALLAAGAGAYMLARQTSLFAVGTIEVSGAPPRVAAHVRQALAPLRGKSLLAIDSAAISERLTRLPDVAAWSYDRSFPHGLRVIITPARPVAVLRSGSRAWIVASDQTSAVCWVCS